MLPLIEAEMLSVAAMRVRNPDRSPMESIAETQPQPIRL
jgi:hypothetical protein